MYNQLQKHLNKYSIVAEEHFWFRTDSTTNEALYKLINETLKAWSSKFILGGTFLILKKILTV